MSTRTIKFRVTSEELRLLDLVARGIRETTGMALDVNKFVKSAALESAAIILENNRSTGGTENGRLGQQQSAVGSGDDGSELPATDGLQAGTGETSPDSESV